MTRGRDRRRRPHAGRPARRPPRGWHPVDLAAHVLRGLVERNDLDPAEVDDVLMGCVDQVGEQALNVGRFAALAAGFPETVPGVTIDRQCGSSQQAAHFAAQGVMAGAYDVVIAAGVESMTRVPMWSNVARAARPSTARACGSATTWPGPVHRPGRVRRDRRRPLGDHARGARRASPLELAPARGARPPTRAGSPARSCPSPVATDDGERGAGRRRRGHPARARPSRRSPRSSRPSARTAG